MHKTLGQLMNDPEDILTWIHHSTNSFIVLHAVTKAGVFQYLDEGPSTIAELARKCELPEDKLSRLLNFLAAEGVVILLPDNVVKHGASARLNHETLISLLTYARGMSAGIDIVPALRQGITPYEYRYGMPVFEHFSNNHEVAEIFASFMEVMTSSVEKFVFSQHEFKPFNLAVDVGGNHGGLLLRLLTKHPQAKGILFDLPEVIEQAEKTMSNPELKERVSFVGGDFFKSVESGGDLYLVKMILHDWNDDECIAILKNIRCAISSQGRLAVIDFVLPEEVAPHPGLGMDIAMLTWATGRERKLSEFKVLFEASGFVFDRLTENANGQSVIEALPV